MLAACSSDTTGPNPDLSCTSLQPTVLSPGQFAISDPGVTPCVALPAAGAAGAEYLYLAIATAGQVTDQGIAGPYALTGNAAAATASSGPAPDVISTALFPAFRRPATAEQFHAMLRLREQALSTDPGTRLFRPDVTRAPSFAAAPVVGDVEDFNVCATDQCTSFVTVTATARQVGGQVAIFTDNSEPVGGGYSQTDIDQVAQLFDDFLYPIDTTNFGPVTDIDQNSVVKVLLTPQINKLSGNCNVTNSVILGYFLSSDLEPSVPGSNKGEIFYGIVPDPNNRNCGISAAFARANLAPTFIHEFQHMISYGQHALRRTGAAEVTWLNEGLSHYAEELGGRLIPDASNPTRGSTETYIQFALSDFQNAFEYLNFPEQVFLIDPASSSGLLPERGANWLFVRWAAEAFGGATPSGFVVKATDFTRKLEETNLTGAPNVVQQSGVPFDRLVSIWQMANYLDDLQGFAPADPLLQYQNLDLRDVFAQLNAQDSQNGTATPQIFTKPYPLTPDSTSGDYARTGTLKQGSSHDVLIKQGANAGPVQFRLTGTASTAISAALIPRIGLVRIR